MNCPILKFSWNQGRYDEADKIATGATDVSIWKTYENGIANE